MMGKSSRNHAAAHHGHLPVLQCWLHSSQTSNAAINRHLIHIWTIPAQLFGKHTSIVVAFSFFNSLANFQIVFLIEIMALMSSCFPTISSEYLQTVSLSLELRPVLPSFVASIFIFFTYIYIFTHILYSSSPSFSQCKGPFTPRMFTIK